MSTLDRARVKAEMLSLLAIDEAALILLEEGGVEELLKGLAVFQHGRVLPAPVIRRLRKLAARMQKDGSA